MNEPLAPTPYDDVNHILQDFVDRIRFILSGQFVGMYLYGSLALGDFDPFRSDIDFLVATEGEIPEASFAALGEMHVQFDRSGSPWAGKIEAAYIPREAMNHSAPTPASYPQVERGTQLFRAPLETGWAFQRCTLRERGVTVAGPAPRELITPVDPADMRRAAVAILGGWLEQSRSDPEWIAWAREQSSLAFIVLTVCRILYSLETGSVASKPAAACWAAQTLDPRWVALIDRSLAGQHATGDASQGELEEMLTYLVYAIEQVRPVG